MVKFKQLSEFKVIELQSDWENNWTAWFGIRFDTRIGDHKGWAFSFELLTLWYLEINYYDTRHEEDYDIYN